MKTVLIIDMSVYFRRAYYNRPTDPMGSLINAMETLVDVHHTYELIAALDAGRESWRNQIYPAYKGNRPPPDPAYSAVMPAMRRLLKIALKIPFYERIYFEADDVVGSLCAELPDTYQKIICSPDKDLMQLVNDERHISQLDTGWPMFLIERNVEDKIGVPPRAIPDLLAHG